MRLSAGLEMDINRLSEEVARKKPKTRVGLNLVLLRFKKELQKHEEELRGLTPSARSKVFRRALGDCAHYYTS